MASYIFEIAESYHKYAGPFLRVKKFCLLVTILPNFQIFMTWIG